MTENVWELCKDQACTQGKQFDCSFHLEINVDGWDLDLWGWFCEQNQVQKHSLHTDRKVSRGVNIEWFYVWIRWNIIPLTSQVLSPKVAIQSWHDLGEQLLALLWVSSGIICMSFSSNEYLGVMSFGKNSRCQLWNTNLQAMYELSNIYTWGCVQLLNQYPKHKILLQTSKISWNAESVYYLNHQALFWYRISRNFQNIPKTIISWSMKCEVICSLVDSGNWRSHQIQLIHIALNLDKPIHAFLVHNNISFQLFNAEEANAKHDFASKLQYDNVRIYVWSFGFTVMSKMISQLRKIM